MYSFIFKNQPKSYNSWKNLTVIGKERYKIDIQKAFSLYFPNHEKIDYDLYGSIYYFFNKDVGSDADNLSKPLWDCLNNYLFHDDKQIKIRIVGVFDLSKTDINILDFSGLPGEIITDLLESFESENHIVYIECGLLDNSMYKFNLERNGN